ncbi:MAG: hypothetical protein AB7O92_34195 [Acidimicrobiia bacterium]
MAPKEEEQLAPRLQVRFASRDAQAADEALEALAEFLARVAVRRWNSQMDRARVSGDPAEGRLPPPGLTTSA